jgi:hypothetical protein
VTLTWPKRHPSGTRASYAIFRTPATTPVCTHHHPPKPQCVFNGDQIGSVDQNLGRQDSYVTTFTDHPPPGRWRYRVALSATAYGPVHSSDYALFSLPVSVTVGSGAAGQ